MVEFLTIFVRRSSPLRAATTAGPSWPFIGQQQLGTRLLTAWQQGQLPSAMLFGGPAHLGKSTAARWLAQYDHCQGAGRRPCGNCVSCRQIADQRHPDVSMVTPVEHETVSVETIRAVTQSFHYARHQAQRQWLLIFEAQQLTEAAANALLKFLEEPPLYATILLTSSQPAMLPATVLSRLAVYYWHLVPPAHLRQKKVGLAAELSADRVARAAGRPGWLESTGIPEEDETVEKWLAALEQGQAPYTEAELKQMTAAQAETVIGSWELGWREILLHATGATERLLWPKWASRFQSLARVFTLERLCLHLDQLRSSRDLLRVHVSPRAVIHDLYVGT